MNIRISESPCIGSGIAHRGAAYAEGTGDAGLGCEERVSIHLRMVAKDFEGLFPVLLALRPRRGGS